MKPKMQNIKQADAAEAIRHVLPYVILSASYPIMGELYNSYIRYAKSPFTLETLITRTKDKEYSPKTKELAFDPTVEETVSKEQIEALKRFLLENDKRSLKKTGSVGKYITSFLSGPFAPIVAVPTGALIGYYTGKGVSKLLEKNLLKSYLELRRQEYLDENQKLINLVNKIKNDNLGLADILALSESVRKRIAEDLYHRTGQDYSELLGLAKKATSSNRSAVYSKKASTAYNTGYELGRGLRNIFGYGGKQVGEAGGSLAASLGKALAEGITEAGKTLWQSASPVIIPAAGLASLALSIVLLKRVLTNREIASKLTSKYKKTLEAWRDELESRMQGDVYPPYYIPRLTDEPVDVKRIRQTLASET
ncbi:MAG: hypothetical protein KatS3mg087_0006 [Patescibacteria group bacterium]|nr:MAG: hypothetical protein KatS3mg087_0006 [Patescibacteria group bacterium]